VNKKNQNIRARGNLVPHQRISADEASAKGIIPTNFVLNSSIAENAWISKATASIGDWRSIARSVYLRWAVTINACHVAKQRYEENPILLYAKSLRWNADAGRYDEEVIASWPPPVGAQQYERTIPLVAAHGVVELFGALEDIVFELYKIFFDYNPEALIRGDQFKALRRLWQGRSRNNQATAAWNQAWEERFAHWRRKRAYDGLHSVFAAFFEHSGLKRPSFYQLTDIDDWSRSVEMIAELRNLIVHGASTVSTRLAELSGGAFEGFVAGEPLEVTLEHLMAVECFSDQLLTAVNVSLLEAAKPSI
jgi:hypothetical protein